MTCILIISKLITVSALLRKRRPRINPNSGLCIDLARKLSISIVAEGVETKEQLDYLNQNNITFQQGYYFYKPVTYIDLVKIILSKPKVKVVVE